MLRTIRRLLFYIITSETDIGRRDVDLFCVLNRLVTLTRRGDNGRLTVDRVRLATMYLGGWFPARCGRFVSGCGNDRGQVRCGGWGAFCVFMLLEHVLPSQTRQMGAAGIR